MVYSIIIMITERVTVGYPGRTTSNYYCIVQWPVDLSITERGGAMVGRGGAFVVVAGGSSACGCLYCLVFLVHSSALGSCLLPNVTRHFFLFTLYIYLQEKHSSDVARRAVLPSVRRYSLSQVKSRIRSCAILFRAAPPTPASHWTLASPLPQFHIQIRFPFTQQCACFV